MTPAPQKSQHREIQTPFVHPTQEGELTDFIHKNAQKYGMVVDTSFRSKVEIGEDGQQKEVVYLTTTLSDGSVHEITISSTPENGDGTGSRQHAFKLDLSNIKNEKQAEEVFGKFFNMMLEAELKNTPAGKGIELTHNGQHKWQHVEDRVLRDMLEQNADKFRDKGILYFKVNGEMLCDFRPKETHDETQNQRKPKPWDVPKAPSGAPKLKKDE